MPTKLYKILELQLCKMKNDVVFCRIKKKPCLLCKEALFGVQTSVFWSANKACLQPKEYYLCKRNRGAGYNILVFNMLADMGRVWEKACGRRFLRIVHLGGCNLWGQKKEPSGAGPEGFLKRAVCFYCRFAAIVTVSVTVR